jgi:hypothetical protein
MRRDENHRNTQPPVDEFLLQLRAGHARHGDVQDQATDAIERAARQECLGSVECQRGEAKLSQQVRQGLADRFVIIDDCDQLLSIHETSMHLFGRRRVDTMVSVGYRCITQCMATADPITIAGSQLAVPRHVCAFFNSTDEEYRVLLPFIQEGFERGDKAVHVLNPERHANHLSRLSAAGIDVAAAAANEQLEIRDNAATYLRQGRFDPDRMLELFEALASCRATQGWPSSRIVCHMDWAVDSGSHVEQLVEFESRVNDVWCRHDDAVVCTYHLSKFGADTVIDILRTHPLVIIGGILQHNPFFIPPEQFLPELRERRARRPAVL